MISKLGNYLGLSRKANYLIIGGDNVKSYQKKMYLIVLSSDCTENLIKIGKNKANQYGIKCIMFKNDLSNYIGTQNCKIVAVKNKGLSDAMLKCEQEYNIIE